MQLSEITTFLQDNEKLIYALIGLAAMALGEGERRRRKRKRARASAGPEKPQCPQVKGE